MQQVQPMVVATSIVYMPQVSEISCRLFWRWKGGTEILSLGSVSCAAEIRHGYRRSLQPIAGPIAGPMLTSWIIWLRPSGVFVQIHTHTSMFTAWSLPE